MKAVNVFGKRSVSEIINVLLRILWVLVWAVPIISIIVLLILGYMEGFDQALIKLSSPAVKLDTTTNIIFEIISWATGMLTIWGLKNMFTNLTNNKIFCPENVMALRIVAVAQLISATLVISDLKFKGIFLSLVIFVLSEIFKVGKDLQTENESIV